jgi:hypothetical protein
MLSFHLEGTFTLLNAQQQTAPTTSAMQYAQ